MFSLRKTAARLRSQKPEAIACERRCQTSQFNRVVDTKRIVRKMGWGKGEEEEFLTVVSDCDSYF
jgi:hypothetical protein